MANLHGRTFTLEYSVPKVNGRVTCALRKMYVISPSVDLRETYRSGAYLKLTLRTFALIVCAQPFCAGYATVICHASLRLTGPEDKHGVENSGGKNFRPSLLLWIIGDPYFLIMNHLLYLLSTKYDKMKKISP